MLQNKNRTQASLGRSLHIRGEVSGKEDLVIHGHVEGRINLEDSNLTVGPDGKVDADIHVKNARISGQVRGHVVAREKVELVDTCDLVGDIKSPRWSMSEGARFKGRVDTVKSNSG